MPYLSNISHKDPNVSEKVNYFCNCFSQVNTHLGKIPRFKFSCPSYIILSIRYQIEFNKANCYPYVKNLISSLNEYDVSIIERSSRTAKQAEIVATMITMIRKSEKEYNRELSVDLVSKMKLLRKVEAELKQNELKVLIADLTGYLGCHHNLKSHKDQLEYIARNLASIYRFRGFNRLSAKMKFNSIFSNSIHDFPFPSHIESIAEKQSRIKSKEDFIANRNFVQQFEAIVHGLEEKERSRYFVMRILNVGVETDASVDFYYDGARVIDVNHPIAQKSRMAVSDNHYARLQDFFLGDNIVLCIIQDDIPNDIRNKIDGVKRKLQSVVAYINGRTKSGSAKADTSQYLETMDFESFGSGFSSEPQNVEIDNYELNFLTDTASNYLQEVNDQLKFNLLYNESTFWQGFFEVDLVKLWQYLENSTPVGRNGKRHVQRVVKNILTYRAKRISNSVYHNDLITVLGNMSPYDQNEFPDDVVKNFRKRNYGDIDILKATKHSENLFIKSLGKNWKDDSSRKALSEFAEHWNDIVIEARAFRNMILHDGQYNPMLKRKLEVCLPYMTQQYMFTCIDLVLRHKSRRHYDRLILSKVDRRNY